MSNLKEQIDKDLKEAMRAKQADIVSTLRMLLSATKELEISLRKGEDIVLSDEQVLKVINSEVKKRKDSISAYEKGGREDLVKKEKEEIEILQKYLPPALSDEEIDKIVKEVVASIGKVGPQDFGRVMGQAMSRAKGRADGNQISAAVKKILS